MTPSSDPSPRKKRADAASPFEAAYGAGFADGRESLARDLLPHLIPHFSDTELADWLHLPLEVLATARGSSVSSESVAGSVDATAAGTGTDVGTGASDSSVAESSHLWYRDTPPSNTMLVEPAFVRLVRTTNHLTQAELARKLRVHVNSVCSWENENKPFRVRVATYELLKTLSHNSATAEATSTPADEVNPTEIP